jgi:hypothetical protein
MTPQTTVMYTAPLRPGARGQVSALLARMNVRPGVIDPMNRLLPLGRLERAHFARLFTLTDLAASDRSVYGLAVDGLPEYFVLLVEIDGDEVPFRRALADIAGPEFTEVLAACEGVASRDVYTWLTEARVAADASYGNWLGRTVKQIREEEALRQSLIRHSIAHAETFCAATPQAIHQELARHVAEACRSGAIHLSPEERTPLVWSLKNAANLLFVPMFLLLLSPLLLFAAPFLLWKIRNWERNDPAIAPPLDLKHAADLSDRENFDVTNQFCVFGSLKPGRLRSWVVRLFLLITDYAARHIYHRGHLARVSTIHFARWVMFEGGKRMLFASIYDGSLESYMDDFINKVGFGLNITFSNGIGYPRTRWLLFDGCKDEMVFKRVLRRHQLDTEVWYSANPGLTAANKHRNSLIRAGVERSDLSEAEARDWLALL